jgi:small subunit ribosomal protein S21
MAKKTVASLQTKSKRLTKAIKMVKSPKTGAYTYVDSIMDPSLVNQWLERMSQVTVGENEGIESALRRFKRSVAKAGIFSDLRRIRHHETPVEKYKRKLKQRSRNRRR